MNEVERAYRRGRYQCLAGLLRDLESELPPKLAKKLLDYENYLCRWRTKQYRKDRLEIPLEFREWLDSKRKKSA